MVDFNNLTENITENTMSQTVNEHIEIPLNSESLIVDEGTSRFSGAIWYNEIQKKTILLAGIGGIGSYVGFLLSRMKPASIIMYDPDIVEEANLSGQLYGLEDLGLFKTEAIRKLMANYSNYTSVWNISNFFNEYTDPSDIMICGFDNMKARRLFFDKWKEHVNTKSKDQRKDCLFIDGRLAAEEFQIFCIRGDDEYNISRYSNNYLFSDEEADTTVCSYKQTTFMANMIASFMVNLFVNFVANQCNPVIDRDLPFYTSYNAETMFYKTEI